MAGHLAILIPARLQSTRLPEKLLRAESGRPLITYAVEAAEAARAAAPERVAEVLVATDSERLAAAVAAYADAAGVGARAVLTRPDHASGTDRIVEVAAGLPEGVRTVINIQGDEPELPAREILRVGELLDADPDAAMSTLVREIHDEAEWRNPAAVKALLDRQGRCLYFSRAPVPHDRDAARGPGEPWGHLHLGIYGYRREVLRGYGELPPSRLEARERLEQLRALEAGLRIVAAVTDYDGTGIDTEEDYRRFLQRRAGADGSPA